MRFVVVMASLLMLCVLPACLDIEEEPECRLNSDCDDDEDCDDNECVPDDDDGNEGEGEGEGEGETGEGEGEGEGGEGEGEGEGEGPVLEICDNFIDDDGNNFTDCADFDCDFAFNCAEDCSNGFDDDGDGRTDCSDAFCSADPSCALGAVPIQSVQDGSIALGATVTLERVFVTLVRTGGNGNMNLAVQEPQGESNNGHPYPEFAGVAVFIPAIATGNFPALSSIVVGDCVDITGEVVDFNGDTEISQVTAFDTTSGCGTQPSPSVVTVGEIATDTDQATFGNQPSFTAENFEGVLVQVQDVSATTSSDDFGFDVTDDFITSVRISDFLLTSPPFVTAGQTFSSITGVFHTFNNTFELQPRTESEIVP